MVVTAFFVLWKLNPFINCADRIKSEVDVVKQMIYVLNQKGASLYQRPVIQSMGVAWYYMYINLRRTGWYILPFAEDAATAPLATPVFRAGTWFRTGLHWIGR